MRGWAWVLGALVACGDDGESAAREAGVPPGDASPSAGYGAVYTGGEFHLGPVDWEETQYHNACASERKYLPAVRSAAGSLLAGTWVGLGQPEAMCDACIAVTTARGKTATLRVVTYGETTRNSLDVSPEAYELLDSGEYPRDVSWQLTKCPESGPLLYEFKTGSNPWWTAFWVRNARLPIARVEVQSANGAFVALTRESDGSFVDSDGVGDGAFSLRVTSVDDQVLTDTFRWSEAQLVNKATAGNANFR